MSDDMTIDEATSAYSKHPTLTPESEKYLTRKWMRVCAELTRLRAELAEAHDIIVAQKLALTARAELAEQKTDGFTRMASGQYQRADSELLRAWSYRKKYRIEKTRAEKAEAERNEWEQKSRSNARAFLEVNAAAVKARAEVAALRAEWKKASESLSKKVDVTTAVCLLASRVIEATFEDPGDAVRWGGAVNAWENLYDAKPEQEGRS